MSSDASPLTSNDFESDIDFSGFSVSSDLDLDFSLRGNGRSTGLMEKGTKSAAPNGRNPESLLVLTAKAIALHFPFEVVESSPLVIPEELQRLIAFHSFPTDEDDIWLYSCLSSGGSYEFDQGEALWADKAVRDCVQIGFFLSATVLTSLLIAPASHNNLNGEGDTVFITTANVSTTSASYQGILNRNLAADTRRLPVNSDADMSNERAPPDSNRAFGFNIEPGYPAHRVSIVFDRNRITSCSCTCTFDVEDGCPNLISPRNLPEGKTSRGLVCGASEFPNPTAFNSSTFSYQPMSSGEPSATQKRGLSRINSGTGLFSYSVSGVSRLGSTAPCLLARPGVRGTTSDMRNRQESTLYSLFDSIFGACHNSSRGLGVVAGNTTPSGTWCSHVVAACLMRIRQPGKVLLRAPISESLSKLSKDDLQKFAQNLICHVGPKKILPAAQHILDQLLAPTDNPLKSSLGAPDPTAGGAIGDAAAWCFDGAVLEEKLRVTLQRFWSSKPSVIYSDICSLNSDSPMDVEKFHCVLHSLRGNDPRGVWDLLSIIGDMMRRQDNNGVLLLEIVTRCIIDMQELMTWWCVVKTKNSVLTKGMPILQRQTQFAALWMCEELVHLWHLACLNPDLRPPHPVVDRIPSGSSCASACSKTTTRSGSPPSDCWLLQQLARRLRAFHLFALEQAGYQPRKLRQNGNDASSLPGVGSCAPSKNGLSSVDYERFSGFKLALAACYIRWPSGLPPTHSLSWEEFRACIPNFTGARVSLPHSINMPDSSDHVVTSACINWMQTITPLKRLQFELNHTTEEPNDHPAAHVFEDLPLPDDEAQLAFARFQALDAHGHTKQSLVWARYLALRLLYLSVDFTAGSEAAAFRVIGSRRPTRSSRSVVTKSSEIIGEVHETANFMQSKFTTTSSATTSSSWTSHTPVQQAPSELLAGPSSKWSSTSEVLSEEAADEAVEWTTKVSQLLDQIRCLMECLTRGYNDSVCNPYNYSAANRITTSGRTLLSFRGPDPNSFNVQLDDMASPVARQTIRHSFTPIKDEWTCIDLELAFRLGFYGLSLPRPPTASPILEVRVFDQEVGLVSRMCRLPIHVACPHVLHSIREEATILTRNLSTFRTDILVPYNLASYIFHVLVGTYPTLKVLVNLADPVKLLRSGNSTENAGELRNPPFPTASHRSTHLDDVNPSECSQATSDVELSNRCPVLATGAILAGCGLPLVVSSHCGRSRSELNALMKSSYLRALDLTTLENALWLDADLGFNAVLSVIGTRSRVPQSEFPYFVEGQWAQLDALTAYLFRHYRDDVEKLDRLLMRLLDRYYNPHFKVPPLWACLSLSPGELMRFNQFPSIPSESYKDEMGDLAATMVKQEPTHPVPAPSVVLSSALTVLPIESPLHSVLAVNSTADTSTESFSRSDAAKGGDTHPLNSGPKVAECAEPAVLEPHLSFEINVVTSMESPIKQLISASQQPDCSLPFYDPTSASEDTDTLSDSKMLSERLRCATLRDPRRRGRQSVGMASVDTSAPETTSSDNSPATSRRLPFLGSPTCSVPLQFGSVHSTPSFSSGDIASTQTSSTPNPRGTHSGPSESSSLLCSRSLRKRIGHTTVQLASVLSSEDDDSIPSRPDPPITEGLNILSSVTYESCLTAVHTDSPVSPVVNPVLTEPQTHTSVTTASTPHDPSISWPHDLKRPPPQQLSDPMAFHMFQLAKSVRKLAGGPTASGSVFVAEPEAHNGIVHANLHLVAFQIGLYGLGMYNRLHSSWRSRTYSRNGGWVSQQVFELGIPAACILYHSWQHHFTAAELAGIAFQLSRENYRPLVDVAAELCLASLSFCTTLRPQEIYRALGQCEEHSTSVLERGLLTIESSENQSVYGILPEIHFFLARSWFSLHQTVTEEYKRAVEISHTRVDQISPDKNHTDSVESLVEPQSIIKVTEGEPTRTGSNNTVIYAPTALARPSLQRTPLLLENASNCSPLSLTSWTGYPPNTSCQSAYPSATVLQPPPLHPVPIPNSTFNSLYNSMGVASDPLLPFGFPNSSLYAPMIYFRQQSNAMQPPYFANVYRPPTAQPTQQMYPSDSQISRFLYATQPAPFPPPYLGTQSAVQCIQHAFSHPFSGGGNVHGTGLLSISPPLSAVQSSFLSYLSANRHAVPLTSSISAPQFVPQAPDALNASLPPFPSANVFNVVFQAPHGTTPVSPPEHSTVVSGPPLTTSVLSAVSTNDSRNSDSSSTSSCTFQGALAHSAFTQLSHSPFVPIPAGLSQTAFAHRFASMSNASGSVVVHPASSDRGSTTSETDSSRPTESVVEGLLEDPNSASQSAPFLLNDTSVSRIASCSLSSNAVANTATVQALEAKSHLYLRRAYLCATSAIKKIFLTQSGTHASSVTATGVSYCGSLSSSRCGRGSRSHHYHQHPHHTVQQRQRIQPPIDQAALSSACCSASDVESVSVGWTRACQLASSDISRLRLPMSADTQLVKVWDVNILWTLDVASGLGPTTVHEYCNLVLQCVQYPLLMKQITTKVIDYFNNLSSQLALVGSSAVSPQPDHYLDNPSSISMQPVVANFPTCNSSEQLEQSIFLTTQLYPIPYPTHTYLSAKSTSPMAVIPAPGAWAAPPNAVGPDAVSPYSQASYIPQYTMPSVWTPAYGQAPTEQHSKQSQMNELITRYQHFGASTQESIQSNTFISDGQFNQSSARADLQHPFYVPPSLPGASNWNVFGQPIHATGNAYQPLTGNGLPHSITHDLQTSGRELVERLINRTHALFHKFIEQRLQYIGQSQTEWDDFVDLILKAYNVHHHMPATDCGLHWNNLLTRIRRHHKCGAALWQRILAGIQTADLKRSG